jgi:hypothetical protein
MKINLEVNYSFGIGWTVTIGDRSMTHPDLAKAIQEIVLIHFFSEAKK